MDNPHIDYGDDCRQAMNKTQQKLVEEGWRIKCELDALQKRLKHLNGQLLEKFGPGVKLVMPGVTSVNLVESSTVSISDVDKLGDSCGSYIEEYMETVTSYKPTAKLKTIAFDEKHEDHDHVTECITIKTSESVKWLAAKPSKAK